jgi:hypothetical protein
MQVPREQPRPHGVRVPEDSGPLQAGDGGPWGAAGRGAAPGAGTGHPGRVRHLHLPGSAYEVSSRASKVGG